MQWEIRLFGWLTPSDVPAFYFQEFQAIYRGTLIKALLDIGSAAMYALHFIAPLLLGWFIYNTFNSNLLAAIPSLHAGYPTTIALFIWLRFGGASWVFFIYPLLAWFSAVYVNQHYVIDLVIGSTYVVVAYFIARKFVLPYLFDRFVDYDRTSRMLTKDRN